MSTDPYYVEFTGEKLGLVFTSAELREKDGKTEKEVAVVKGFAKNTRGDLLDDVAVGDYVFSVNGEDVTAMTYAEVLERIKSASRPTRLGFNRFKKKVTSDFRKETKSNLLQDIGALSRQVAHAHERRERAMKLLSEVQPYKEPLVKKMTTLEEKLDAVMTQRIHGTDKDDELARLEKAISDCSTNKKKLIAQVRNVREQLKAAQESHDQVFYAHLGIRHALSELDTELARRRSSVLSTLSSETAGAAGGLLSQALARAADLEDDHTRGMEGAGADLVTGWEAEKVKGLKTLVGLRRRMADASKARDVLLARIREESKRRARERARERAGAQGSTVDFDADALAAAAAGGPARSPAASPRGSPERGIGSLERALDKSALMVAHAEMHARDFGAGLARRSAGDDGPDVRALHLAVHLLCQNAALQRELVERSRRSVLRAQAQAAASAGGHV